MPKINVLLVDDSNFMRVVLNDILSSDKDINVVDTAQNGKEAFEKTMHHNPDVVLLDITMKDFDGIYAIKQIMKEKPTPIVVLSASGNSSPDKVMEAMEEGAYDFIHKPVGFANSKIREIQSYILSTIRDAAAVDVKKLKKEFRKNTHKHTFEGQLPYDVICIGASTGGTGAIEQILTNLPSNLPIPILIAQHMPNEFTHSFAQRLDNLIPMKVKVAMDDEVVYPNTVYINPGNTNMKIIRKQGIPRISYTSEQFKEFNGPSVDSLFQSAADIYRNRAIGVILTGMGRDGTLGLKKMYQNGAYTIAQDERTSVVWGMPKSAVEAGIVKSTLPIYEIPMFLVGCIS